MRYASIDIGTNTLRLLVAEKAAPGSAEQLDIILYKRIITRLGGGFTPAGGINLEASERTLKALEEFRRDIDSIGGAGSVDAVATSVVRRAVNSAEFIDAAAQRAGVDIRVISGDEEARLSLLGVLSVLGEKDAGGKRKKLVIDIGGGSTEFIATDSTGINGAWSLEMGVVHLTERFITSDPPEDKELDMLRTEITGVIDGLKETMAHAGVDPGDYSTDAGAVFVGTAGTITTLAALDQQLDVYDRKRINNYTITKERIEALYGYLAGLTIRQREEVLSLEKGREDLIIPGAAITIEVMRSFGFENIVVSDAGLLEGVILDKLGYGTTGAG